MRDWLWPLAASDSREPLRREATKRPPVTDDQRIDPVQPDCHSETAARQLPENRLRSERPRDQAPITDNMHLLVPGLCRESGQLRLGGGVAKRTKLEDPMAIKSVDPLDCPAAEPARTVVDDKCPLIHGCMRSLGTCNT